MTTKQLLVVLTSAVSAAASAQWSYYALNDGGTLITDLTPNGQYAAGFAGSNYFRWSVGGGLEVFAGSHSAGNAYISADGRYIGGEALIAGNRYAGRLDTTTSTWTLMSHPAGWGHIGVNYSGMFGMDDTGNVLAAAVYDAGNRYKPVSYDMTTMSHGFNPTQGATFHARPNDMSGDGMTIVGWDQVSGRNASAWRGGVQVYFDSGVPGEIFGTTTNGTKHFGIRSNMPTVWNNSFVPTTLALPSGFTTGAAVSGTDDGSLMVGYAQVGNTISTRRAVIWVNNSPQLLSNWAAANGMTFSSTLVATAVDITPDGRTIGGWRLDGTQKGFIMQNAVPEPTTLTAVVVAGIGILSRRRRK
jgi:hypothetical protein